MSEPVLLYEEKDHVATITFNRPDQMNTITPRMLAALSERLLEADADPAARVIVITGNGRAWCAGLDVSAFVLGGILLAGVAWIAFVIGETGRPSNPTPGEARQARSA